MHHPLTGKGLAFLLTFVAGCSDLSSNSNGPGARAGDTTVGDGDDTTAGGDDANGDTNTGGDAAFGDGTVVLPSSGEVFIDACSTLGTGSERCSFVFGLDPTQCANQGCSKMVVFFAGGGMDCSASPIGTYAADGYVAVCARLFETATGSALVAFNEEATRADLILQGIAGHADLNAAWSGEYLLWSGVSHGATAPVIAMARTTLDEQDTWQGSTRTAACFYDGIADAAGLDEWLGTNGCGAIGSVLSHRRHVGRYYGGTGPIAHSCINGKCLCDASHSIEMDEDSLVGISPSNFAINDWKLIECGSATDPCSEDVVPAPPIQALCNAIDADAQHSCAFESYPMLTHMQCGPASACLQWFNAMAP